MQENTDPSTGTKIALVSAAFAAVGAAIYGLDKYFSKEKTREARRIATDTYEIKSLVTELQKITAGIVPKRDVVEEFLATSTTQLKLNDPLLQQYTQLIAEHIELSGTYATVSQKSQDLIAHLESCVSNSTKLLECLDHIIKAINVIERESSIKKGEEKSTKVQVSLTAPKSRFEFSPDYGLISAENVKSKSQSENSPTIK